MDSDDERCERTTGPQGSSGAVSSDEVHSYSLCLLGNLLDFGEDTAAGGFVCEVPFQVESPVTQVSCGLNFICLLTANGRVYTTSSSHETQYSHLLKPNRLPSQLVPRPLPFPVEMKIVRLSCGTSHGGFVVENGSLFMFGCSSYGRLGIGDSVASDYCHTPVQVRMTWSAIQAKVARTKAAVSCGIPVIHHKPPVEASTTVVPQVSPETDECPQQDVTNDEDEIVFADISCGDRHTLVLGAKALSIPTSSTSSSNALNLVKNSIISFGDGMNGRLGVGSESDAATGTLVTVFTASQYSRGGLVPTITSISAGVAHSAALSSSGELFTWGNGADGQLGHGVCESEWVPRQVEFFKSLPLATVKCGARHTVAVTRTGAVYTWGCDQEGQLGTGLAGGLSSDLDQDQDPSRAWRLPQKVQLVVDPLAIQQMNIDAQVQAAFTAASALGGGGSGSLGTSSSAAAATQQQLQQDLRVTVRSIVATADGCMALDEHARLFTWGSNRDQQLGVRLRETSFDKVKCPPVQDIAVRHPTFTVPKPSQIMYMELHEFTPRQQQQQQQKTSNSSRVTTIRDQVHAMSSASSVISRQALVCFNASDRFSVLVFKTKPVRGGSLRVGDGIGMSGDSVLIDSALLSVSVLAKTTEPEPERGTNALVSFPNRSQLRLLAHQQQQSDRWKLVSDALAREQTTIRINDAGVKPESKWHFSLLQELRTEDVPSKESEYYKLMANYKVYLRRPGTNTIDGATNPGTTPTSVAFSTKFLGLDECDYNIGGFQALNSSTGDDHFSISTDRNASGRRRATQRPVASRRTTSANNNSVNRTPRAPDSVGSGGFDLDAVTTTEATNPRPRFRSAAATPSPQPVRGVDDWLQKHSPTKSPPRKALYAFGTAERFQARASNTLSCHNNNKDDEAQSPRRPAVKATSSRIEQNIMCPRSSRVQGSELQPPLMSPTERLMRPKSAFGHTLRTAFSTRKLTIAPRSSGAVVSTNILSGAAVPATKAAVLNTPHRPPKSAKRAASASARSRAPTSLKLQLYHKQRQQQELGGFSAFGSSAKSRFDPESQAKTKDTQLPLHPETSSPLVYLTSPRFSMGSGEDYSLVVARRLSRARGRTPGPGTYDRHGG